jgi:hypothetical protein
MTAGPAQRAQQAQRGRVRAAGSHSSQRHAQVLGLDDHPTPSARRWVCSHPATCLVNHSCPGTPGEQLNDPRELGQSEAPPPGQVPDVSGAEERNERCSHTECTGMARASTRSS